MIGFDCAQPDSQYSVGMKPVLYSETEAQLSGTGWTRAGSEMAYFKDNRSAEDTDKPAQVIISLVLDSLNIL